MAVGKRSLFASAVNSCTSAALFIGTFFQPLMEWLLPYVSWLIHTPLLSTGATCDDGDAATNSSAPGHKSGQWLAPRGQNWYYAVTFLQRLVTNE